MNLYSCSPLYPFFPKKMLRTTPFACAQTSAAHYQTGRAYAQPFPLPHALVFLLPRCFSNNRVMTIKKVKRLAHQETCTLRYMPRCTSDKISHQLLSIVCIPVVPPWTHFKHVYCSIYGALQEGTGMCSGYQFRQCQGQQCICTKALLLHG